MKLLIPYITAGWPSRRGSLDLLKACAAGGADRIEIGIPFSDPMADGPVIQQACQRALDLGFRMEHAFALARSFRERPLLFMTYLNPVLAMGMNSFLLRMRHAGVAGAVIPDLPPEEAPERGMIFLCSPTCREDRIRLIDRRTRDFIYLVSLRGVTGTRAALPSDLASFVRRVRRLSDKTLCVGFGISTPEHAAKVARVADGVIVGSAILRTAEKSGPRGVERFVRSLRRAID